MKAIDCVRAARKNLNDARRYLESGDAVNWIATSISTAILWAMEGWLISNGHQIRHGKGWGDTREAFMKHGPAELRSKLVSVYSQVEYLELDLMGGEESIGSSLTMNEWKANAKSCLDDAEKSIHQLLSNIESDNDVRAGHGR